MFTWEAIVLLQRCLLAEHEFGTPNLGAFGLSAPNIDINRAT